MDNADRRLFRAIANQRCCHVIAFVGLCLCVVSFLFAAQVTPHARVDNFEYDVNTLNTSACREENDSLVVSCNSPCVADALTSTTTGVHFGAQLLHSPSGGSDRWTNFIVAVHVQRCCNLQAQNADSFVRFIVSPGQHIISEFGDNKQYQHSYAFQQRDRHALMDIAIFQNDRTLPGRKEPALVAYNYSVLDIWPRLSPSDVATPSWSAKCKAGCSNAWNIQRIVLSLECKVSTLDKVVAISGLTTLKATQPLHFHTKTSQLFGLVFSLGALGWLLYKSDIMPIMCRIINGETQQYVKNK